MPNFSFYHNVPVMVQPMDWACWYTAYQMIVAYMRSINRGGDLKDPSEVAWVQAIFNANRGLGTDDPEERGRVAAALNFATVYATLTSDGLADLLQAAPIMYDGRWVGGNSGHAVVLAGMSGEDMIYVDPATGVSRMNWNRFVSRELEPTRSRPLAHPP
jgi:hypothetical protein